MTEQYQFNKPEDINKIQTICDFFNIGKILDWTSLPVIVPFTSLMKLHTHQGTYSVKAYERLKKKQLSNIFDLKKQLNSRDIPLCLSLDHRLYEDEVSCWTVMPWAEGSCLKPADISKSHIRSIAQILGKIHQMNICLPAAPAVLSNHMMRTDFSDLQFLYWRRLFEQHVDLLTENRVISHGDLLPQNVVWTSDQNPVLIDWDNAGWINQDIDLFNTAINWAGIESGIFNRPLYDYFIAVYLIENPRKIQIDQSLICASLGSWLNWWTLNDQLGNQKAVEMTWQSLAVLKREFF